MDALRFISDSLRQVHVRIMATCDGLTQEQVLWRPAPHANSIGFILWHVSRGEDIAAARLSGGGVETSLWVSERWHERFGQSQDAPDPGDRMGFQALNIPEVGVLRDYSEAVHARMQSVLSSMTSAGLDRPDPGSPDRPAAASLRHLITHKNNHHGQIDYIRGLQDESWDLPMGTGMTLPE